VQKVSVEEPRTARFRKYAGFVRQIVALHPKLFITAVSGAFVFALCTVASSIAIRWVIDEVIIPRFDEGSVATRRVVIGCSLVVGIGLLRAVGVVVRRSFAGMTQWRVAETLTNEVTDRYVEQPVSWHRRQSDGQLLSHAGVDIDTTIGVLAPIPFATSTVLMLFVAAGWLISVDPVMGCVAVAVFPLLVGLNVLYERQVTRHFDAAQDALGEFSGAVHESFEAVQLIKAYGAEKRETDRLSALAIRIRDPRIRAHQLRGTFEALLETIPSLTNIGIVVLGAYRVDGGAITVGELSGFIFMFTVLVFPLRLIGYALSELPASYAGYRRVRGVLDQPFDDDPSAALATANGEAAVEIDHAWFTYHGDPQPTITETSIEVRRGSITSIVGATGSGKTTLVELIAGLLPPDSGTIAVDPGPHALVFQEGFLFSGTIRENIAVGDPITDDEIWNALQLASADEFVRHLPDALDTVVGERGVTLSGGQRQRVALSRALVRHPSLLLLDDTTSALDPATEQRVLDNLRRSMSDTTVVMVASRPSTIALADEVVFVDAGSVIAQGSHDHLMATVDGYRNLVEAFETDRDNQPAPKRRSDR
jgi:ABC-type multidrug transport system fused ATPase/permease subunit